MREKFLDIVKKLKGEFAYILFSLISFCKNFVESCHMALALLFSTFFLVKKWCDIFGLITKGTIFFCYF